MLSEQNFIADQIAVLRKRLNSIPPAEKIASAQLVKAYEVRNKSLSNIKAQLVEMIGKEDAFEMIVDAEKDAEKWWNEERVGTIER